MHANARGQRQLNTKVLAQHEYFDSPDFIAYLKYLQYWRSPKYARFILFPHALYFLHLLQHSTFRDALKRRKFTNPPSSFSLSLPAQFSIHIHPLSPLPGAGFFYRSVLTQENFTSPETNSMRGDVF